MNRLSYLACSGAMFALAALVGVAMARWRNHTDHANQSNPWRPTPPPAQVSNLDEDPGLSVDVVVGDEQRLDPLEDAGMYFRTPQPLFHIADEQGCVSDQGLEQAGVSLDHKDEIQAAIDVAWKRILASMKERVQPDARNSDAEKGIRAYLIPAQMGLREEILGKLESDFTRICGAEQGSLLLRGLHPGGHFGYFGRQSLMVRIVPKADGEGKQAEYSAFDPVSGNQILSGTETNPDRFRALFGNAIEW